MVLPEVLISVKPRFLHGLLDGSKQVELRRRTVSLPAGSRVWIYGTKPHGSIDAYGIVGRVHVATPAHIWKLYGDLTGLIRTEFSEYFRGCDRACAIAFSSVVPLPRPASLNEIRTDIGAFFPPQFLKRLRAGSEELDFLIRRLKKRSRQG